MHLGGRRGKETVAGLEKLRRKREVGFGEEKTGGPGGRSIAAKISDFGGGGWALAGRVAMVRVDPVSGGRDGFGGASPWVRSGGESEEETETSDLDLGRATETVRVGGGMEGGRRRPEPEREVG